MDIADVSRQSGLKPSTLRYYEKLGLIRSIGRNGLRRQYAPSVLNKLNIICLGRLAGLSLVEISAMFDDKDELAIDRALLTKKTHEIDAQIKRLQAVRDSLNHVANCPEPSHLDCPSFQKMMKSVKHYL
ncbi:MerR family transcriptional regulator [Vibrio coralliilyticus]|uniref:MerR family transcriptional regulator n=1 Tax=Vibrio coralliilyticus TaxID=190893 RepID=A0A2A2MY59_9VIBR|nr:helix-turn-helix domain-containing protein [Vibrio coralliilyticus]ERB64545.1 MerR family transcriptional regulator [Vibrio coralliilyticus OCN008]KJY69479.1 MerR family transcriptional regulator [Vibrio coralliilyticus]NOI74711.1 helix-turn-helix domain-containing protein [Vibrio coralliilyticus]PAW05299.1 MerR family transcriptional regulator [Vibrio coralliilyticus]QIJ87019.1 helix-turn-helix domain-containing protein [Vibrio coralliilyticus OCN008]